MRNAFENEKCSENNEKWKKSIKREAEIYAKNNDIRSEFERDYTRLLHCQAYRRLKHKTQVFFAPHNDHICTRMEHVSPAVIKHPDNMFLELSGNRIVYLAVNLSCSSK